MEIASPKLGDATRHIPLAQASRFASRAFAAVLASTMLLLSGCEERPLPPVSSYEDAEVGRIRETLGMPPAKEATAESDGDESDSPEGKQAADEAAKSPMRSPMRAFSEGTTRIAHSPARTAFKLSGRVAPPAG